MRELPDSELIKSIQDGDVAAFEILVKKYQGRLLFYVVGILHRQELAEEVVEDTFLSVYKNIDKVDPTQKFSSYLYKVARNTAFSYLRREKEELRLNEVINLSHEDDVIEKLITKEKRERIAELLGGLKKTEQLALDLYYFEGLSYKEIAHELNIPLNSVRTALKRGKESLKKVWGKEEY